MRSAAPISSATSAADDAEIKSLVDGVYRRWGYDFREYSAPSLKRRILAHVDAERLKSVTELLVSVLDDTQCMERLLLALSVNVTSLFRDPSFYRVFREKAVPLLRTYPLIRIWHVGCSTGEEVYSMAILMHEEKLYDRCKIYATDMNEAVLRKAKDGIFPLASMMAYTANYQNAGGKASLSEYYTAMYDGARIRPWLKENLVFAQHNLTTDGSFNEFQVIMCRNVLIYFNKALGSRVHKLLRDSLVRLGYLGLGSNESLKFTPFEACYRPLEQHERLYRKIA